MSRAVLIVGATGKQGGALINALLASKSDLRLLAVTRDPASASARSLAAKSSRISLVQGDITDPDAIFTKAEKASGGPVWGTFSVQVVTTKTDSNGVSVEEAQGKALVDSAVKHGVQRFVYTSVDRHGASSIDNPTAVPHFISKHNIEQHLIKTARGTATTWTILRPVAFMDNLDGSFFAKVFASAWRRGITRRGLQLVAAEDIGVFAAMAFLEPERWEGRALSLAGDELTFAELDSVYRAKTGAAVPTTWGFLAMVIIWMAKDLRLMLEFFDSEGYAADIPELKKMHPGLKSLSAFLEDKEGKKKA